MVRFVTLRELIFVTMYNDPDIERVLTAQTGVENGKKLGYIHDMGDVGKNASGCNPTYDSVNVNGLEKTWDLGPWQIADKICYEELENTLAKYGLNTGTDIANLNDTPYMDEILIPLLERAIRDMFWRIVWFGDKNAKNISQSGLITDDVDLKLFTMADGLWKRLRTIVAGAPGQYTKIDANTATEEVSNPEYSETNNTVPETISTVTYASQKAALKEDGAAINVIDDMLSECDSRIFDDPDAAIMMTNSMFKALRNDVKRLHNLQLEVEHVTNGIQLSKYDGHPVIVLDIWDRMIKKYENDGVKLNQPHRVLIAAPTNLFAGTSDKNMIADLSVTFDDVTRLNHIFAQSNIGTLVGEDELVHVAY